MVEAAFRPGPMSGPNLSEIQRDGAHPSAAGSGRDAPAHPDSGG